MDIEDYQRADIEREIALLESALAEIEERRCETLARLDLLRQSLAKLSASPDQKRDG